MSETGEEGHVICDACDAAVYSSDFQRCTRNVDSMLTVNIFVTAQLYLSRDGLKEECAIKLCLFREHLRKVREVYTASITV